MEVKSKEQKTFTYTLTINSYELDELLSQMGDLVTGVHNKKVDSLYSKLLSARNHDLAHE